MSRCRSISSCRVVSIVSAVCCLFAGSVFADDPKPASQSWKRRLVLEGHSDAVRSVAFSPDGKLIASGSEDRTVRLWDVKSGDSVGLLAGHEASVVCVAFSPDGQILASASSDFDYENQRLIGGLKLWDVATGQEMGKPVVEADTIVFAVAFSDDGKYLAVGGCRRTGDKPLLTIWDVSSGEKLKAINDFTRSVQFVAFSPDGKTVAVGSNGSDPSSLWDWREGKQVLELEASSLGSLKFSRDGRTLFDLGRDGVQIWDVNSGSATRTLSCSWPLAMTREGKTFFCAVPWTKRFSVVHGGEKVISADFDLDHRVQAADFSFNGEILAIACRGKTEQIVPPERNAAVEDSNLLKAPVREGDLRGVVEVWTRVGGSGSDRGSGSRGGTGGSGSSSSK